METHRAVSRPHTAPTQPGGFDALTDCHRDTLRMLAEFEMLLVRLERTGIDSHARTMAATIEHHFSVTLRAHHDEEERQVFQALLASGDAETQATVARLKQDHAWMEMNWRELWPMVNAIASGHSWYDLDVLRAGIEVVSSLEREHIELEESLIYPRARKATYDSQHARLSHGAQGHRRAERLRMLRAEPSASPRSTYRR